MKFIATLTLCVLAGLSLNSCGTGCSCNSYNPDALRDVPATSTRSFSY